MLLIKEIIAAVELVGKSVKNIKEIHSAIKSGIDYLKVKHPEVKDDLKLMCIELQKTCDSIAKSSAIITHFRFNGSPDAIQHEPTRFNSEYKDYKLDAHFAEKEILALKGSCSKIKYAIDKYHDNASKKSIFKFLGLHDQQKEDQLFEAIQAIYNDEMDFHHNVYWMGKAITDAINHVSSSLENNLMMDYTLVPKAAILLNDYAKHFSELESIAKKTKEELEEIIEKL